MIMAISQHGGRYQSPQKGRKNCCCGRDLGCNDCPYFDCSSKPSFMDVDFEGVSLCVCFDVTAGSVRSQKIIINTGSINTTHRLNHTSGGIYLVGGGSVPIATGVIEQYDNPGCTGSLLNTINIEIHPYLKITDNCRIEALRLGYNSAGASNVFNFSDDGGDSLVVNNSNFTCSSGIRGTGGTGTISFPSGDTREGRKQGFARDVTAVVESIAIDSSCHADFGVSEKFTESTFSGTFCLEWDGSVYSTTTSIGRNFYPSSSSCSGPASPTTSSVSLTYNPTSGVMSISAGTIIILDGEIFNDTNPGDLCLNSPLIFNSNASTGVGSGGTVTLSPCCAA